VSVASINVGHRTRESFRGAARRINQAARESGQAAGVALRGIGEEIMTDVKASRPGAGVPRDEGTLANSGRVEGPVPTPIGPAVELSFGGAAAPYALVQHERDDYRHTVGESRYLVRGMERWRPGQSAAMEALRQNTEAAFGKGGSPGRA
jgi:hypothetical protein